jgi:hypothetical protein
MATDNYWEDWQDSWKNLFVEVDKACNAFLSDKTGWSVIQYRWDNPDRMLSGPVHDGFRGNIHILFVSETSTFRFSYAVWHDEDRVVDRGVDRRHPYRVSMRSWSTNNDYGDKDLNLPIKEATEEIVTKILDDTWGRLRKLSNLPPKRQDLIKRTPV